MAISIKKKNNKSFNSRKHLNKTRKFENKTRKMRGGSQKNLSLKPNYSITKPGPLHRIVKSLGWKTKKVGRYEQHISDIQKRARNQKLLKAQAESQQRLIGNPGNMANLVQKKINFIRYQTPESQKNVFGLGNKFNYSAKYGPSYIKNATNLRKGYTKEYVYSCSKYSSRP